MHARTSIQICTHPSTRAHTLLITHTPCIFPLRIAPTYLAPFPNVYTCHSNKKGSRTQTQACSHTHTHAEQTRMHTPTQTQTHVHIRTRIHIHIHIHIHICIHIHIHIHIHIYIHIHMHMHIHTFAHTHTYVKMRTQTQIHTNTSPERSGLPSGKVNGSIRHLLLIMCAFPYVKACSWVFCWSSMACFAGI